LIKIFAFLPKKHQYCNNNVIHIDNSDADRYLYNINVKHNSLKRLV